MKEKLPFQNAMKMEIMIATSHLKQQTARLQSNTTPTATKVTNKTS